MEIDLQFGTLWSRIEHLLKNKLQGVLGGSFLVESGLKSADLETIGRGWRIVTSNQMVVLRCINHLIFLGQSAQFEPERCDLREQVQMAVNEFEGLPDRAEFQSGIEYLLSESPVVVLGEPQLIRSAIIGLLRIAFEANRDSSDRKVVVRYLSDGVELISYGSQLDWKSLWEPDISNGNRLYELLLIEWGVAALAIKRQRGKLLAGHEDRRIWFKIELPGG
jgi:hypothetical protein